MGNGLTPAIPWRDAEFIAYKLDGAHDRGVVHIKTPKFMHGALFGIEGDTLCRVQYAGNNGDSGRYEDPPKPRCSAKVQHGQHVCAKCMTALLKIIGFLED